MTFSFIKSLITSWFTCLFLLLQFLMLICIQFLIYIYVCVWYLRVQYNYIHIHLGYIIQMAKNTIFAIFMIVLVLGLFTLKYIKYFHVCFFIWWVFVHHLFIFITTRIKMIFIIVLNMCYQGWWWRTHEEENCVMNTLYKTPFVYLKSVPLNVLQSGEQDKEEGHVGDGQEWPKIVSALLAAKIEFFCYLPTDQSIIKYILIK